MTLDDLIDYIKPYLKANGYKKTNRRWTKTTSDFTFVFYIQKSAYDKNDFYIRPGIYINSLLPTTIPYGHFFTEIAQTTPENVISDFEVFCQQWSKKQQIRNEIIMFEKWEKENPIEKRRLGIINSSDYAPSPVSFTVPVSVREYIINNF